MNSNEHAPTSCDRSCINRRAFLGESALGALAVLLASACGDGQIGSATGPLETVSGTTITLADYPALANVGGMASINGLRSPVAIVHTGTSTYRAFSLVCPHQGTTVSITGGGFLCPNHRAQFTSTGQWVGGERTSNMREVSITVDGAAGTITFV